MTDDQLNKINKKLSKKLKPDRYDHTLGVAYTAACMAMRYDVDAKKAFTAGLLHDCAKAYSSDKYIDMCKEFDLPINEFEEKNPGLLHAKLGGFLAKEKYDIDDNEIIEAIKYHTTGKPDMNMLEKIIFIADYIEPNRTKAKRLSEIRKMTFENIDNALLMILEDTMDYLIKKSEVIDIQTQKTFDFYKEQN